jgi:hypothetical protein
MAIEKIKILGAILELLDKQPILEVLNWAGLALLCSW